MSRLTPEQLDALKDAHASIGYGGLSEACAGNGNGTIWVGSKPECATEHRNSTIHFLFVKGLLNMIGAKPMRTAEISELGIFELDIEGVTQ